MMNPNPYESPASDISHIRNAPMRFAIAAFAIVLLASFLFALIAPTVATLAGAPRDIVTPLFGISMSACMPFGCVVAIATCLIMRYRWRTRQLCWFFASLLIVVPIALHPRFAGPLVGYTGFAIFATITTAIFAVWLIRRFAPQSIALAQTAG